MSADERVTRSDKPHDRLTNLCDGMTDWMDAAVAAERVLDPEASDVRAIVFLDDGHQGGIVIHGYDDVDDAIVDLLMHIRAMFHSVGRDVQFVAVPNSPEGL